MGKLNDKHIVFLVACDGDENPVDLCEDFSLSVSASEAQITFTITEGTAPYGYVITYSGGTEQIGATNNTSETITATAYEAATIVLTDASACTVSASLAAGDLVDPCDDLTVTVSGEDTQITLTITEGTAPFDYVITYEGGTVQEGTTSDEVTVIDAEVYEEASIAVTDASGCTETMTLADGDLSNPCLDFALDVSVEGQDLVFAITEGTAPYDYEITYEGGGVQSGTLDTQSGNVEAKEFEPATIELTDAKECVTTDVLATLEDPCVGFEVEAVGSDGEITITITGGTAPYDYEINYDNDAVQTGTSSETEFTVTADEIEDATITVTDAYRCETEAEDEVDEDDLTTLLDTRDDQRYSIVTIGDQVWLGENFNYDDGTGECHGNVPANCDEYGKLYTYAAATAVGFAPEGWRLPTNTDAEELKTFLGTDPGAKLKEGGSSGFEAKLGGAKNNGVFNTLGTSGYIWTNTEDTVFPGEILVIFVSSGNSFLTTDVGLDPSLSVSVRFIKE